MNHWHDLTTDAQRIAQIEFACDSYIAFSADETRIDATPAFDFAGDAANDYLPWCLKRMRELESYQCLFEKEKK